MMKELCKLSTRTAIEIIKETKSVMYREGVWNKYKEETTEKAIERIEKSGYGVDVYVDDNGVYYISEPCSSDMW